MNPQAPWTVVLHCPYLAENGEDFPFYIALVKVLDGQSEYLQALSALKKAQAEAAKAWRKDQKEQGIEELVNPVDFKMVFCSRGHADVKYFGFQAGFEP